MSQSTTVVSLPHMVDLALNSPEVGIVNFTILHSLLHVIVNQLDLQDINVEFRGSDSERLQSYIATAKPGPLLTLTEYIVGPDSVDRKDRGGRKKSKRVSLDEKGKKDEDQKEKAEVPQVESDDNKSTVVVVKSSKGSVEAPQFTVVVTKNHFDKLEEHIEKLEVRIKELAELPGNSALIHAIRAEDPLATPVLDMYQILNLTKRLDAAEVVMEKLASMMEDLAKNGPLMPEEGEDAGTPDVGEMGKRVEKLENAVFGGGDMVKFEGDIDTMDLSTLPPHQAIQILQQELQKMKAKADAFATALADLEEIKKMFSGQAEEENLPPEARLNQLEIKFNDCMEQLGSLDNMFSRQVNNLTKRISDLEEQFGQVMEKINLGMPGGDSEVEGQSMSELYNKLVQLQDEMSDLAEAAQQLMEERSDRQHTLDVLLEQIELLKTVKADREDLEDALADKADACQVNRKVSLEQFDATCGDMSRAIEEALNKLSEQEALWTQALEELQKDIGNKLDKVELTPLRDFINSKLKSLQDKFKALTSLKRDNEAAGTKSKLLKNVNCISCDKDVVMRKQVDSSLYPKPYALPPTKSMAPYLAYELDQLRKQQKCLPNSRNLNALENALQSARSAKSPDHLCNRYCGGSHTLTTPQQRVTRLGHFLEQWGPEIGAAHDTSIRGTDGQMYKGRDDKSLKEFAAAHPSTPVTGDRPDQGSRTTMPGSPSAHGEPVVEPTISKTDAGSKLQVTAPPASRIEVRKGSATSSKAEIKKGSGELSKADVRPKSGTDVHATGSQKSAGDVSGAERRPSAGEPGEVARKASGTESPKKSASRSSAKGSKASLQKVPSAAKPAEGGSAEKVEPIPEEPAAEAAAEAAPPAEAEG